MMQATQQNEARGLAAKLRTSLRPLAVFFAVALIAIPAFAQAVRISFEDARRIALEQIPNGQVESIELKQRSRPPVYEVDVRDARGVEHEVTIDANDGRVVRVEIDDD